MVTAPSPTPDIPRNEDEARAIAQRREIREQRLAFPPLYVIVGAYRLCTDKQMYIPVWDKCRHGFVRGMCVGAVWGVLTYKIQKTFVDSFLRNSPRVTGLSNDSLFGYQLPFSVTTYASLLFLTSQITIILNFFLSRNLRIARGRAWDYTVHSRGKGPEFWKPYVEEWARPPRVDVKENGWDKLLSSWVGRVIVRRVILIPFSFYPILGVGISAYIKALGTARYLHKSYFEAKKMTPTQVAVFMEERKWHYRTFGFSAALLEGIPIIGLAFSISNRVGAAMWAHDLEKRQHAVAAGEVPLVTPDLPVSIEMDRLGASRDGGAGAGGVAMAGGWDGIEKNE